MTQTRRLAAILAGDVVGYSRLIEADEEGTLNRLKSIRAEVIDPKITEHRGRIVKTTGDGKLWLSTLTSACSSSENCVARSPTGASA